jgi:hypothetical protein
MSQNSEDLIYTITEATNNADFRLGYYEIQLHKNGLMRNVQNCVIKRKVDSFHWLQHQRQISGDNLNNVRRKKH